MCVCLNFFLLELWTYWKQKKIDCGPAALSIYCLCLATNFVCIICVKFILGSHLALFKPLRLSRCNFSGWTIVFRRFVLFIRHLRPGGVNRKIIINFSWNGRFIVYIGNLLLSIKSSAPGILGSSYEGIQITTVQIFTG